MINALDYEEKTYIKKIKSRKEIINENFYKQIESKIKCGIKFYFLLSWNRLSYSELTEALRRILISQSFQRKLILYQQDFWKSLNLPQTMINMELNNLKLQNPERYHYIKIFLGEEDYHIEKSVEEILREVKTWIKEISERKEQYFNEFTFYSHFPNTSRKHIFLIFECLKNEEPEYYLILEKAFGKTLTEIYENEIKEEQIKEVIEFINKVLKEEQKQNLKIDEIDKIFIKSKNHTQKMPKSLYSKFPNEFEETINAIVDYLKGAYPKYYNVIIKRHGKNLLEWNKTLTNPELGTYAKAISKMKQILVEIKNGEILLDQNGKIINPFTLYSKFPDESKETINTIVDYLKETTPNYYNIIIKRHGENLLECNKTLTNPERATYFNAINRMKQILVEIKNGEILLDQNGKKINPYTLYRKFPNESKEMINAIVDYLKEKAPKYYNIIIKRHGENLLECNKTLTNPELTTYARAINRMNQILVEIKNGEILLDQNGKIINPYNLYSKFPDESKETINAIVDYLKETTPNYYNIIIKRHGENLLECKKILTNQERTTYFNAINRMKQILVEIKN